MPRRESGTAPRGDGGAGNAAVADAGPGSGGGIAIPALAGEAAVDGGELSPAKDELERAGPPGDGPESVPLPEEAEDAPEGAGEGADGEAGGGKRTEDRAPGKGPGVAI